MLNIEPSGSFITSTHLKNSTDMADITIGYTGEEELDWIIDHFGKGFFITLSPYISSIYDGNYASVDIGDSLNKEMFISKYALLGSVNRVLFKTLDEFKEHLESKKLEELKSITI